MKFRKKPVVVEAIRWFLNGTHPDDNCDMFDYPDAAGNIFTRPGEGKVVRYFRHPDIGGESLCQHCNAVMHRHGWIDTPQGGHTVCPGDWIINEPTRPGEYYPCKPDAFEATYEAVEA